MTRLFLLGVLVLFSPLVFFRAPTNLLWYVSILLTEFCWIFFGLTGLLLLWQFGSPKYAAAANVAGLLALLLYALPVVQALVLAPRLKRQFVAAFGSQATNNAEAPFQPLRMLTGIGAKQFSPTVHAYDAANNLTLDFYASQKAGVRPCVVVVHGGSWAAGDSKQLPELNSELAKEGYHVASINYRLAPIHRFPAPVDDVCKALVYLRTQAAALGIDAARLTLLGRSAGGQVALSAAYGAAGKLLNGVIAFYGPTDMVWGYENPCNPLVLDSRKVMEDYLGGGLQAVPSQYVQSSATETVPDAPLPTLLLYGENDPLVSPRHGNRLTKKLDEKGAKYVSVYLPWATHGFDYTLNGPGGQLSTWAVKRFLEAVNEKQSQ